MPIPLLAYAPDKMGLWLKGAGMVRVVEPYKGGVVKL